MKVAQSRPTLCNPMDCRSKCLGARLLGFEFKFYVSPAVSLSLLSFSHSVVPDSFVTPMDCSQPGSSDRGILQARILEWISIPFSSGYSQLRDQTWVSCIVGRFFAIGATREAQFGESSNIFLIANVTEKASEANGIDVHT